jgi:hypothetical protein
MNQVTLIMAHFCNLGMFAEQQRIWMAYPAELRKALHVIVVDDCSPKSGRLSRKSVTVEGLASLQIFRLQQKKRWNWSACRNLGALMATTPWLFLTDIDHAIPPATMHRVLCGPLEPTDVYRFKRVTAPGRWPYDVARCAPWKPHNDTFLLTRRLFFDDQVSGYDERLSGCYGTSGEFRDRVVAASRARVLLDEVVLRYPREVIPDASTPPEIYTRKNDPVNDADIQQRKEARELIPQWRPLRGLLPWEEVYAEGVS